MWKHGTDEEKEEAKIDSGELFIMFQSQKSLVQLTSGRIRD